MAIIDETFYLSADQRAALGAIVDGHTNAFVGAWVLLWDNLSVDFSLAIDQLMVGAVDGRVSAAKVAQSERLAIALQVTQQGLNELVGGIEVTVADDLPGIVQNAAAGQVALMKSQLPVVTAGPQLSFNMVSADAMDAMVKRTLEQIHSATRPLAADIVATMKRELIRGIAVGTTHAALRSGSWGTPRAGLTGDLHGP